MKVTVADVERMARAGECEALAGVLLDAPEKVRFSAAAALAGCRSPESFAALVRAAQDDPGMGVRARAARSIPAASPDRDAALAALVDLLEAPEVAVRVGALRGLATLADLRALPHLDRMLAAKEHVVRFEAVQAIGSLRGPGVRAALERAQGDRRWLVRKLAKGHAKQLPEP